MKRVKDQHMVYDSPIEQVGKTPITYWGTHRDATLWIKEEGKNPTGSVKDRTAAGIVDDAQKRGVPKNVRFLDTSSGSFACSLAYFATLYGYETTVVVNSKISADNLAFLRLVGAEIIEHGTVTGEGRELCEQMREKDPDAWCFADQLTNPLAPKIHEATTGPEIFEDIQDVAAIVGSKGSGATLCGITRYVTAQNLNTRVFGSIAVPGDEKKIAGTYLDGVDFISPFITELGKMDMYGGDMPVYYAEAMANTTELLRKGFLVGPQGGGVFTAALKAIEQERISGNVVLVTGDTLLKNVSRF